jgi:hypothetical protein
VETSLRMRRERPDMDFVNVAGLRPLPDAGRAGGGPALDRFLNAIP